MSRYIDADRFAEKMKRQYCENCDNYQGIRCKACPNGDWLDDLYDQPTADAVEVVRCKDCRYWNHETDLTYCSKKTWLGTDAEDYCSYGERAEE